MLRSLALTFVVFSVFAAFAPADWTAENQRPADKQLRAQARLAVEFWAERNVTGCPDGIKATISDKIRNSEDPHDRADGLGGQCEIVISEDLTKVARARGGRRWMTAARTEECTTVVHEVFHALPGGNEGGVDGLGHTDGGVMDASMPETPWDCKQWARRSVHAAVRAARR